jgi:hypothetical protein
MDQTRSQDGSTPSDYVGRKRDLRILIVDDHAGGFDEFLLKPLDTEQLARMLSEHPRDEARSMKSRFPRAEASLP